MANSAIVVQGQQIAVSDSDGLNHALSNLSNTLIDNATQIVDAAISGEEYTALERRSMIVVEALRLTHGMDLAAILTRGALIKQIEQEGLVSVHPGRFSTLTEMAEDQGISVGELSDTRTLCEVIFPYLESAGISVAGIWASVGKSTFREMAPALSAMITGEQPAHASVRASVEGLLAASAASLIEQGLITNYVPDNREEADARMAQVRHNAIINLVQLASTTPTRQMRATLRPSRTPPVNGVYLVSENNGRLTQDGGYVLLKVESQDQFDMLRRLLGTHVVATSVNTHGNQAAAPYTTAFRRLMGA